MPLCILRCINYGNVKVKLFVNLLYERLIKTFTVKKCFSAVEKIDCQSIVFKLNLGIVESSVNAWNISPYSCVDLGKLIIIKKKNCTTQVDALSDTSCVLCRICR